MTKIFISADMEGVNGVVSPSDIIPGELGYETARVLMTEEVNAVVEGCLRGGATEIVVCDAHEAAQNIRVDLLNESVELIRGSSRADSMVHSIDHTFHGLILLGHHAKFGTEKAVLDHTYDQYLVRDLRINNVSYGEVGVNSLFAAEQGVPLLMASGDDALAKEVQAFDGNAEVAVVKKAEGRYCAKGIPLGVSNSLLASTAEKTVRSFQSRTCMTVPETLNLEVTFQQTCMADGASRVEGVRRIGSMSVSYLCTSMKELMKVRQIILLGAAEFYDSRF